jgi:Ca2+-transporting ATPase
MLNKYSIFQQNEMHVVAGCVGVNLQYAVDHNADRIPSSHQEEAKSWSVDQKELSSHIDGPIRRLFNDAIAVNSSAFEEAEKEEIEENKSQLSILQKVRQALGKTQVAKKEEKVGKRFVGSKTETALLYMSKDLDWEDYRTARARSEVVTSYPFSSERKAMAVVVKQEEGGYRLHVKGASEILTKLCAQHVEVDRNLPSSDVITSAFTKDTRRQIEESITFYAGQTLRTIALCYKDFEVWPPEGAMLDEEGLVTYDSLAKDMTLLAITAIEDPLRPGVREAVTACGMAGVMVKMVTGDNVLTAKSIATQCGIFTEGGIVMEGPEFRKLNISEMMEVVPRLQVMARCSPEDKKVLVECLKSMDHVVACTGDGTNDSPALKSANVGLSMGISGTEVAREASDIILMDDNFASIVTAIMWGRCVGDSVQKFCQFQLSVNIGAVIVVLATAISSPDEKAAFTAVQLLWINLIMDTLAALALATDPASPELLKRKPARKNDPLITTDMWKQILGQAAIQVVFILALYFKGKQILSMDATDPITLIHDDNLLRALIFNTYVFLQLFNLPNCRILDRKLNIFKDLHKNAWFISILLIEVSLQMLIAYKGGQAFSVVPMGGREWAIVIVGGSLVWPTGVLIRLCPTEPIHNFLVRIKMMPDPNALPRHNKPDFSDENVEKFKKDWEEQPAIVEVAEELYTFNRIRGGRSSGLARFRKSKRRSVHPSGIMSLVPAVVASGIGFDWKSSSTQAPHPQT